MPVTLEEAVQQVIKVRFEWEMALIQIRIAYAESEAKRKLDELKHDFPHYFEGDNK